MSIFRKTSFLVLSILIGLFFTSGEAFSADKFPEKSITMLCGFSAGGGTDVVGRKIAQGMEKYLGQPVLVVNKPGGGSLVSVQELVSSPKDGYTLNFLPILNGFIQKYLNSIPVWVDPLENLICLGVVNADFWGIAVKADCPINTVPEFVEYLKANPDTKVGDPGLSAGYHWGWEKFFTTTGVKVRTVAYKGTSQALTALAGGEIFAASTSAPEAASLAGAGMIKVIGLSSPERQPKYPDIPTFKDQGIDMVYGIYRAVVAQKGIPEAAVTKLSAAVKSAYESEDYQKFLKTTGYGSVYMGPEEGQEFFKELDATVKELMTNSGVIRKEYQN